MKWSMEWSLIKATSEEYNVDPHFIATIRRIENGGPGRQFGVLSVPAPSYAEQLQVTCNSVRNRLVSMPGNPLRMYPGPRHKVLGYTDRFIEVFASVWAPIGVPNDPHALNKNWITNCANIYRAMLLAGGTDTSWTDLGSES